MHKCTRIRRDAETAVVAARREEEARHLCSLSCVVWPGKQVLGSATMWLADPSSSW